MPRKDWGRGEEARKGRPAVPQVCTERDRAPGGAAQWYLSLSISLLSGKKKKANSAAANFAQLHLSTSNQPTGRKSLKKIDERFYLNALKGNVSIHSDWPVTLSILWLKIIQTFKII